MPFGEIGAVLLFLVVVFIFGNLWFHFVETFLRQIKKLFPCRRDPGHGTHFLPGRMTKFNLTGKFPFSAPVRWKPDRRIFVPCS